MGHAIFSLHLIGNRYLHVDGTYLLISRLSCTSVWMRSGYYSTYVPGRNAPDVNIIALLSQGEASFCESFSYAVIPTILQYRIRDINLLRVALRRIRFLAPALELQVVICMKQKTLRCGYDHHHEGGRFE